VIEHSAQPTATRASGPAADLDLRDNDQASRLRRLVRSLRSVESGAERVHAARSTSELSVEPRSDSSCASEPEPPACSSPVLAVASGKGGVGKTCVAVGIASAQAELGRRPVLLDADPGMANADVLCGVNPNRRLDLTRARREAVPGLAVKVPWGFDLIPGAVGISGSGYRVDMSPRATCEALAGAADLGAPIVVDCGGGLGPGVLEFIDRADLTLLVATPDPTSIADAYALLKTVVRRSGPPAGSIALVVNAADSADQARRVHDRVERVADRFLGIGIDCAGWIPRDGSAVAAVRRRRPVLFDAPSCPAALGIRDLATWTDRRLNMLHSGAVPPCSCANGSH